MLKNESCRRILAAFGGVSLLAGVGTTGTAFAAEYGAVLSGENGPPVVNLDRPDGEDEDEDDCDTIGDALADEIQANPAGFYVNIHTSDHPDGALRGQLAPTAD